VYCGIFPREKLADSMLKSFLDDAGVSYSQRLPDQVRAATRDGRTWFCNFGSNRYEIVANTPIDWLVGDSTLEAYDVAVADESIIEAFEIEPR
jgi:beta-galactosidase